MRILSISAQKPDSTGSGIYMTELVKALSEMGHTQAVIAGISKDDTVILPEDVSFFPVCFDTEELPFHVVGMSDEMPYESTRYRDMDKDMTERFIKAFTRKAGEVIEKFRPDIILCHHLYLMTASVRKAFPDKIIYGFCHNTDIRQMTKTDLRREYIRENIRSLDRIFAAGEDQKAKIKEIYGVSSDIIKIIGTGYNSHIFYDRGIRAKDGRIRLIFAGKIAEKKGAMSLLRSMSLLSDGMKKKTELRLAGGAGNKEEYETIKRLAELCPVNTELLGKLDQNKLAEWYNKSDIFVLPSYFDSIPLSMVEALACGLKVVISDLPGLKDWVDKSIKNADVIYVSMPEMRDADEPEKESLPGFEKRLAMAIEESAGRECAAPADLSNVSWKGVANKVLG